MLNECPNCSAIWSPGTEEWEDQHCSACGWRPGKPIGEEDGDDDWRTDFEIPEDAWV